ncbi:MAG: hypothetical protein CL913_10330 [Deltaproteobacteria bacterium]|nr:hypothetical protein [Deltaproteobacteria bacterium]
MLNSVDASNISGLYSFTLTMRGLYFTCTFLPLEKNLGLEYFDCEYSAITEFDQCLESQTTFFLLQHCWFLILHDVLEYF